MKKLVIALLALIINFSIVFAQNVKTDSLNYQQEVNFYQPLYMQNKVTDNIWINQPVKETIRWSYGSYCLAGMGIIISESITNSPSLISTEFIPPQDILALTFGLAGASIGLISGICKAIVYDKQIETGKKPIIRKPKLTTEYKQSYYRDDKDKAFMAFSLRLQKDLFIFDELLLNTVSSDWQKVNGGIESKIFLGVSDIYNYDENISFYYNLLGGYSFGIYRIEDKSFSKKNFASMIQTGIELNIIDFAYIKIESEYEYSPFYYHLKDIGISEGKMLDIDNFNLSLVLGTSIF